MSGKLHGLKNDIQKSDEQFSRLQAQYTEDLHEKEKQLDQLETKNMLMQVESSRNVKLLEEKERDSEFLKRKLVDMEETLRKKVKTVKDMNGKYMRLERSLQEKEMKIEEQNNTETSNIDSQLLLMLLTHNGCKLLEEQEKVKELERQIRNESKMDLWELINGILLALICTKCSQVLCSMLYINVQHQFHLQLCICLLYTSPSPRDS